MKVEFHYRTVDPSGGMLTLFEDTDSLPRLPEVGENVLIPSGPTPRLYTVEKIEWKIERFNPNLDDLPVYVLTMIIHCLAHTSSKPTS